MQKPTMRAIVTFLSREAGGRSSPPVDLASGLYMPHLVLQPPDVRVARVKKDNQGDEDYLGVRFIAGPDRPLPGEPIECTLELIYYPEVNYDSLTPGATFTVREGGRIVGYGTVGG